MTLVDGRTFFDRSTAQTLESVLERRPPTQPVTP
jgi:hypothetical protein